MNAMVFALILFLLVLTYSRSGYIGTFIAAAFSYAISLIYAWKKKKIQFSFSLKKIISSIVI